MQNEKRERLSDKETQSEYFRKWYQENKDALLEKRRKRWKDDPEYRRKNLERKRASREKEKEEKRHLREECLGTLISLLEKDGYDPATIMKAVSYLPNGARGFPKVFELESGPELLYPMGYLCVRIARTSQTIRSWHEKGVLPSSTFIDASSWRWYSWSYIEKVAQAAKEVRDSGPWSLEKLKEILDRQ